MGGEAAAGSERARERERGGATGGGRKRVRVRGSAWRGGGGVGWPVGWWEGVFEKPSWVVPVKKTAESIFLFFV
jgi:hypothetical protein